MARPLTKSPPLTFRLSIETYSVFAARAEAKNMTVTAFVTDYLDRAAAATPATNPLAPPYRTTPTPARGQVTPMPKGGAPRG